MTKCSHKKSKKNSLLFATSSKPITQTGPPLFDQIVASDGWKLHNESTFVNSDKGLYQITYNVDVSLNQNIAQQFGEVTLSASLDNKSIKGSQSHIGLNPSDFSPSTTTTTPLHMQTAIQNT